MGAKEFERLVYRTARIFEKLGLLILDRRETAVRQIAVAGPDGPLLVTRKIPTGPDFDGLFADGRYFAFDAKVCSGPSLQTDPTHLPGPQLRFMLRRARFGAFCGLLVHYNRRELKRKTVPARTFLIPVSPRIDFWKDIAGDEDVRRRIPPDAAAELGAEVPWGRFPKGRTFLPDLFTGLRRLRRLLEDA